MIQVTGYQFNCFTCLPFLQKPVGLLASGVAAMLLSCMMFLGLLFFLCQEFFVWEKRSLPHVNTSSNSWFLDEMLILFIITMLVISMGSSSMIEEEQYIWYFFTTSFYLVVLRKIMQSVTSRTVQNTNDMIESYKGRYIQIFLIIVVLISGRILRGWHQGGVNWAHLPDIAKWLEQAGSNYIKLLQMGSVVLVISINLFSLLWLKWSQRKYFMAVALIYSFPGLLVLLYITKYQDLTFTASSFEATLMAQIIYAVLIISAVGTTAFVPWFMPIKNHFFLSSDDSSIFQNSFPMVVRDLSYVVGYNYIYCWCLLQLLLQQPINSVAFLLLFMQIFASIWHFSNSDRLFRQWVEVSHICKHSFNLLLLYLVSSEYPCTLSANSWLDFNFCMHIHENILIIGKGLEICTLLLYEMVISMMIFILQPCIANCSKENNSKEKQNRSEWGVKDWWSGIKFSYLKCRSL